MPPLESDLRNQLGVPDSASGVLILGMDAHMDWDWRYTFQTLIFKGYTSDGITYPPVKEIIKTAWQLMIANQQSGQPAYLYSVCEMGFLRAVVELYPDLITEFTTYKLNQQLSIEGGGITSPDNLLPHGEAFIRNYLAGWAWQQASLGLQSIYAYMPDDFGHDAQLPVMLEAMGFAGVSFSRLPGSWASSQFNPLDTSQQSLYTQLTAPGKADFFWQASDGSSVFAHLEQNAYWQANSLGQYCKDPQQAISDVSTNLGMNQPSSPSPYVYVPCGNDFAAPIPCLLEIAAAYNNQVPQPTTHAVVGTLEQYIQLVMAWSANNPGKLVSRTMDPTPYWTGFYASRPANKILHHATVRALLGAEVFGVIADLQTNDSLAWEPVQTARRQSIAQGWESLVPSTHHDYITGTAVDSVYTEEQLPLLRAAYAIGDGARKTAIEEIATLISATPGPNETPVAVFNQLGFEVTGLVEIPGLPGQTITNVRSEENVTGPVQTTPDGKLLFMATAPSLGYATYYLSDQPNSTSLVSAQGDTDSITFQNSQMSVTVSRALNWAISSWQPKVGGTLQSDLIPTGQAANALAFYEDSGNLYNFGNEIDTGTLTTVQQMQPVAGDAQIIESGPVRVRIQAQVTFSDGVSKADYIVEYTLVAGEPFWRSAVTGSVPLPPDPNNPSNAKPYSVMVRFPFTSAVDNVLRGTPYHWHDQLPVAYWNGPTFQATHHFVVPSSTGTTLGAFYHADVPAWAIESGALIGCILRNTPGIDPWPTSSQNRGANGVDFGVHTRRYAGRIPQGIELPPSGLSLFEESFGYTTALQGAYINVPTAGVTPGNPVDVTFPTQLSLASVTSGNAILTVAKEGQFNPAAMILRLYQPSNASQTVTLSLADYIKATKNPPSQVTPVTALEQSIASAQPIPVTNGQVTVPMNRALVTLAVTRVATTLKTRIAYCQK